MRRQGMLMCLVGPAGGGKTTLRARLLADFPGEVMASISVTTRAPRPGEVNGTHYHFVGRDEFMARRAAGEFFESEEVHGNLYGTLKRTLEDAIVRGVDLLLDIDIRGALRFRREYPNHAVVVFMVPPDTAALVARLRNRGPVTAAEVSTRVETARGEYRMLLDVADDPAAVHYFVVNGAIEETYAAIKAIRFAEQHRLLRLDRGDVADRCRIDAAVVGASRVTT